MNQRFNLEDPRIKRYLDSLDPKYRKMLEDIDREQQSGNNIEEIRKLIRQRSQNVEGGA
jgi:hypothetical protein